MNWMPLARKVALRSPSDNFKVGAVLVNKKPISIGFNKALKSDPILYKLGYHPLASLHAELNACAGVDGQMLNGASLWVARVKRDGSFGLAKPCRLCYRYLADAGLHRVYYTTETGYESIKLET